MILIEKWSNSGKDRFGKLYDIYENPSKTELEKIMRENKFDDARFIADPQTKTVYVFDGELLHDDAIRILGLDRENIVTGVVSNGSYGPRSTVYMQYSILKRMRKLDWKWAEKYIPELIDLKESSLREVWKDAFKSFDDTFDVYENPTGSEIRDLRRNSEYHELRFIADSKTKKVYMFDANFLHWDAMQSLDLPEEDYRYALGLWGVGSGPELHMSMHDVQEIEKRHDWNWADKYLPGLSELINQYEISESYATTARFLDSLYEIFVNPSKSEILSVSKTNEYGEVRFIADSETEKLYVFGAEFFHEDAYRALGLLNALKYNNNGRFSQGVISGYPRNVDFFVDLYKGAQDKNWAWVDKYISGFEAEVKAQTKHW